MEYTAIILGLAGSLHCMLMCGPLAMAVTHGRRSLSLKLLYNFGRILTYAILGAVITSLGTLLDLSSFHLVLTIALAATLLLMGIFGMTTVSFPYAGILLKFTSSLKILFGSFLKNKNVFSVFMMGMVNGLLPCGITYLSLTYCLTLQGPVDGFNFMMLFGAGTLPAMLGLTQGLSALVKRFNINSATIMRYSFIILGILVLARVLFIVHPADHALHTGGILFCQ